MHYFIRKTDLFEVLRIKNLTLIRINIVLTGKEGRVCWGEYH